MSHMGRHEARIDRRLPMQKPSEPTPPALPWWRDPMHRAVHAVGITQITAWGTAFYCLGVLAGPIGRDLDFTRSFVFLGFTMAMLTQGLVSAPIGRLIDRWGGRNVMCVGVVLIAIGLALLAQVRDWVSYLAVWVFLGVAMRMSLYDAAFAAIVQVAPSRGRTGISYLTLYGAFASTVFWVVGHQLEEALGWRQTLLIFAALNLVVCLPLNWWGLAKREERPKDTPGIDDGGATGRRQAARRARAHDRHDPFRTHHVAQWLRLRRGVGPARAAVRDRRHGHRHRGVDRLAQGRRPVRRPRHRDRLWPQPARLHRRPLRDRRAALLAAPAPVQQRRLRDRSSPSRS